MQLQDNAEQSWLLKLLLAKILISMRFNPIYTITFSNAILSKDLWAISFT